MATTYFSQILMHDFEAENTHDIEQYGRSAGLLYNRFGFNQKSKFVQEVVEHYLTFKTIEPENTHLLCKGSITIQLTSCLTGQDSAALLLFNQIEIYKLGRIQTSQTGGQPNSDTSYYEVSVLCSSQSSHMLWQKVFQHWSLAQTPGYPGVAQPIPHEVTPIKVQIPFLITTRGPKIFNIFAASHSGKSYSVTYGSCN